MPVKMTRSQEKIFLYLRTHRRPVEAKLLAERFMMNRSHTSSILKFLQDQGLADVIEVGQKKFYKIKD